MAKLNFYALWSVQDAPRPFSCKAKRGCFQVHIPLPLPEQLVIFGLGEWRHDDATISAEVLVSPDVPAQNIGTLSSQVRSLTWEGGWNPDMVTTAARIGRRGAYGKILLTVCGQPQDSSSVLSSIASLHRKSLFPDQDNVTHLSSTLLHTTMDEMLCESVCSAEIQVNPINTSGSTTGFKPPLWSSDNTPRCTVIRRRDCLKWSSEDMDWDQASTPKKMKRKQLFRMNSQEALAEQIKNEDREVSVCPSKRGSHTMVLTDPDTAILIGGEASDQDHVQDPLWKLELDGDFWFPIKSSASDPAPLCARGHTATYDPDSKEVFVYGGLGEGQHWSQLYILNTVTWKWKLVTAGGSFPNVSHHAAAFYKNELFVIGGFQLSGSSGKKCCSNALYIFNPKFELWYQPIVEGHRPLPRFGHSATLLSHKIIIFGGRTTATYLNDLHVLDLGFMEYTAVKCGNMPPLPRGFHAALPVLDNRILVSGGCSTIGALQDVHVFNLDTSTWSSVASPPLSLRPRAGHSVIGLGCDTRTETERQRHGRGSNIQCTLLVFGGSDCSGTFYNDTVKCRVDIPGDTSCSSSH